MAYHSSEPRRGPSSLLNGQPAWTAAVDKQAGWLPLGDFDPFGIEVEWRGRAGAHEVCQFVVFVAAIASFSCDSVGWSALYGALAVVVPGAVMARGITSKVASMNPGAAVAGFFLWEMVKIGLTVAMLFAAPRLVENLSWPAMLVGLIVTMKVSWGVLWFKPKRPTTHQT